MKDVLETERILHVDDRCVVVNKKVGEAMDSAGEGMVDLAASLAKAVAPGKKADGSPFPPTAVHRLDVPVTGCALFARDTEALAFLNKAFADGTARKTYWAVVEKPQDGRQLPEGQVELVHWLSFDPKANKSRAFDSDGPERKRSVLRYRVVGSGDRYLFLEVELITGRHHQIRAQLAAEGLVIKGDLKYGSRRSEKGGGIRLHARSLAFPDISRPGAYVQATAPLPEGNALWSAFEAAAR